MVPPSHVGMRWGRIAAAIVACTLTAIVVGFVVALVTWRWFVDPASAQAAIRATLASARTVSLLVNGVVFVAIYVAFLRGVATRRWGQLAIVVFGYWICGQLLAFVVPGMNVWNLPWTEMGRDVLAVVVACGIDHMTRRTPLASLSTTRPGA
jgi:hypothetical protein